MQKLSDTTKILIKDMTGGDGLHNKKTTISELREIMIEVAKYNDMSLAYQNQIKNATPNDIVREAQYPIGPGNLKIEILKP